MITGLVNANLEAIVPVELVATDGHRHLCNALIDTGFDGQLVLPSDLLDGLNWPHRGRRTAVLGDGSRTAFNTYRGNIIWNGNPRTVHVLEGAKDAIVGMRLLEGDRVIIDVLESGSVQIVGLDQK